MSDPQTQQDGVRVNGPDGKIYLFPKGTDKTKAIAYFKKKGISAKPANADPYGMGTSKFLPGKETADVQKGKSEKANEQAQDKSHKALVSGTDYVSKELPAVGGAGFGIAAGGKTNPVGVGMAALGGMAGQAGNEIIQRLIFNRSGGGIPTGSKDDTNYNTVKDILVEGVKQGGLELVGRKAGDIFFSLLNKIPHAAIKNGIRLLPSDLGGGKITKYVEDLLTNLIPSAKTMAEFKAGQNKDVIGAAEKLAKGFSRFRGTTEEMGQLLQDTYRSFERTARQALETQEAALKAKGVKPAADKGFRDAVNEYTKNFKSELASKIAKTNKPELIGGFLRSSSSLQETRDMVSFLEKESPVTANAVRTRLMRDTLQEALTGSTDPVLKDLQKQGVTFTGSKFKQALDSIGEDKLKAIYGQQRYDAIMDFSKLIQNVGSGGSSGAGKFLNFIFILGPIRSGFTAKTIGHIAGEGFIFNRAAKIITNPQGVQLYENFIRASAVGSVKAISAARDALVTYTSHADAEYVQERKDIEDQYYKEHPDEVKYRHLNKENN